MSKVAVLGGTRFIGPAIVDALAARGHAVTSCTAGARRRTATTSMRCG